MLLHHYSPTRTLRSTDQFFLDVPRFSTEFGKRSFSYWAPTVWDGQPLNIRLSPTFDPFKRRLKTHFSNSSSTPLPCCPPSDCQCLWFSITTECLRVINACIIIIDKLYSTYCLKSFLSIMTMVHYNQLWVEFCVVTSVHKPVIVF